jgi:hypothetical protein
MYIVPPKLQRRLLIGGLTVPEALLYLGLFLLFVLIKSIPLLAMSCTSALLSWRFNSERNAYFFFKILYKYYRPSQVFTRRL